MRSPCPEFDLFRHVLVTGGTGCGKTVSVVLPLLARAIARDAADGSRKPALFVVDVKGDITAALRRMARANGRTSDLIEISAESPDTTNLLVDLGRDPFTGGQILTSAVYHRMGFADIGKENGFWQVGAVGYVSSAFAWLQFLRQPCTAANLSMLLTSEASQDWDFPSGLNFPAASIELAATQLRRSPDLALNQLAILLGRLRELQAADGKTRANFISVLAQVIETLAHPLSRIVTSSSATWSPESWLREGKILLVRLPFATEPGPSNFIVRLLKLSLYRTILSRFGPNMADVGRPVFLFMDEAHRFVTADTEAGDQYFVDRCRAMRTGCVFATQSLAALSGVLQGPHLDSFLANINTRVFGRSLDETTATTASAILGDADLIRDYRGTRIVLSPDPDPEMPPQPTFELNSDGNRRITAADIAQLEIGEFFVAEGASLYRWEAAIEANDHSPEILGASQDSPIPSWLELDEMRELRDVILHPHEVTDSPKVAEGSETPQITPDPVESGISEPSQTSDSAPAQSPDVLHPEEAPKIKRPTWLPPKREEASPSASRPNEEPPIRSALEDGPKDKK
jgi:TraM recognition site of TraD and TraG